MTDGQGRILLFNPAAESIFGHEPKEVLGEPLDLLIPLDIRAKPERSGPGGRLSGRARPTPRRPIATRLEVSPILGKTVELTGRKRDGGGFPIEISFSAVEANGRIEYVASIRDQTERQRMRAMLAHTDKLASIGLLSAGVAHEINNPLSYVGNNLAVLQRDVTGHAGDARRGRGRVSGDPGRAARDGRAVRGDRRGRSTGRTSARTLAPMIDRTLEGVRRVANIVQNMRGLARTSRPRWEAVTVRRAARHAPLR